MESEDTVLTVDEVRRLLKLSRGLTYEAIRTGQIPSIRVGRRILIPRLALQKFLSGMPCPNDCGIRGETMVGKALGNETCVQNKAIEGTKKPKPIRHEPTK